MPKAKKIDYVEDVQNSSIEELVDKVDETPNLVEEKAEEIEIPDKTIDKAIKEEKEEKIEDKSPIDVDKLKEDLKQEVTKEVTEKNVEKMKEVFGLTEDQKKEQTPWEKENRNPSWTEALEYMAAKNKEDTKKEVFEELQRQKDEVENKQKEEQEHQETIEKQYNDMWDSQIEDLVSKGRIPKMVKEGDDGYNARVELFKTMSLVNQERSKQGLPLITNLKEIFLDHYKAPTTQPDGGDAPIAGAKKSVSNNSEDKLSYHEIHGSSFEDLMR
jgi:hypothetical protein